MEWWHAELAEHVNWHWLEPSSVHVAREALLAQALLSQVTGRDEEGMRQNTNRNNKVLSMSFFIAIPKRLQKAPGRNSVVNLSSTPPRRISLSQSGRISVLFNWSQWFERVQEKAGRV